MNQTDVEQQLAALISEGKISCFKCGERLNGENIQGFDLEPADGRPKFFYVCGNEFCKRHNVQGYRTLMAFGIADKTDVSNDSPLSAARAPERESVPADDVFDEDEDEEDDEEEIQEPDGEAEQEADSEVENLENQVL